MSTQRKSMGWLLVFLSSTYAMAEDCPLPAWPTLEDPATIKALDQVDTDQKYREDVSTFVRCNRLALAKRGTKSNAAQITALVQETYKRETELLARADALRSCIVAYRKAATPDLAKTECDETIRLGLAQRVSPKDSGAVSKLMHEEYSAFGGKWSYDIDEFEARPCSGGSCERTFGMSLTNLTPVELLCRVYLTAQPRDQRDTQHVEQTAIVPPGHTVAAAKLTEDISRGPTVSGSATCEQKRWPESAMTANCSLRWSRPPSGYPAGFKRDWISGAATLELTAKDRAAPADVVVTDDNSIEAVGRNAMNALKPLRIFTNCPGVRVRVRLEFLTTPCMPCTGEGTITMIRN